MNVHTVRRRAWAAIALASVMALSACGSGDGGSTADGDTFTFVAVIPVSGPLAESGGIPSRNTLETGIKILNDEGGIDGRQIKLDVVDTAGDATKGVANLQAYLADNPKPDVVFGQYSFEALPLAPITTKEEVLFLSSSVTPVLNDPGKFPYTFQQSIPIRTLIDNLSTHIADEGYEKVGYVAVDDESGHTSVDAFEQVASEKGLSIVEGYVPADAVDATATLERLRSQDPDVVVISAVGPAAATILKSRTDIGWDVPTIGEGSAFAANDLGEISDPKYWHNVMVQTANWQVKDSNITGTPAFEKFLAAYKADHDINIGMGHLVCLWEVLLTAKAAHEQADSEDAAALAKALESTGAGTIPDSIKEHWVGVEGFGYSADNHDNAMWEHDDFTYVPAQALVDGMATTDSK